MAQTPALLLLARVMRHLGSEAALVGRNIERAFATAGRNVRAAIRRLAVRTRPATRDKTLPPTVSVDTVELAAGLATITASTVAPAPPPLMQEAGHTHHDARQPMPLFPPPPPPPLLPGAAVPCVPPPLPSTLPPPPPPLLVAQLDQDPRDPLPMREIPMLPPPPSASAVWLARQVLWPTVPRGIPARSGRRQLSSDSDSSSDSSSGASFAEPDNGRWPAKPPMMRTVSTIFPRTAAPAAHLASASRSGSDETWEQVSDDDDDQEDQGNQGDQGDRANILGEGSSGRSASNDSELGAWVIQDSDL